MLEIRLVLLGDGGVGKSALCFAYLQGIWIETYDPTIEELHRKQTSIDDEELIVSILDTAGQEEFSMMQDQWFSEGDGFFFVYSIDSRKSFDDAFRLRDRLLQSKNALTTESSSTIPPMVLLGNKCDLTPKRQVSATEAETRSASVKTQLFETSAKSGHNVVIAFEHLIRLVRTRKGSKRKENTSASLKGCKIL